jgi:hypothetical protein
MVAKLGILEKVELRMIWPHEGHNFTPWLAENIDKLGEVLGLDLEVISQEAPVGEFSVDIVAKDVNADSLVVIENQYGTTDHDHLGKLLTYASGIGAKTLIWITETLRDEHRQALEWLNVQTSEDTRFFAIEMEVLKIGESLPAHHFKVVVSPNNWSKQAHSSVVGDTPRGEAYRAFFRVLTDELRETYHFTNARATSPMNWYAYATGFSGLTYAADFSSGKRVRVELYIDRGEQEENKRLFEWLMGRKQEIEQKLGVALAWERLELKRASRIAYYQQGVIEDSSETLVETRQWMIQYLLKLKQVFTPLLNEYFNKK